MVLIGVPYGAVVLSGTNALARGVAEPAPPPAFACPVTRGGQAPATGGDNHRKPGLWTPLPRDGNLRITTSVPLAPGTTFGRVYSDGSLSTKFPWFGSRLANNKLVISGKRLDRPARALHRTLRTGPGGPSARGWPHFWPGYLRFATAGCWRVTARSGRAHRTFTISVAAFDAQSGTNRTP